MKTIDILKLPLEKKMNGIFIKGDINDGEYKIWWADKPLSKLYIHCFYKDGALHGHWKRYSHEGKLINHVLYNHGYIINKYL